ncbi:hypothetical protein WMY93_027640 [Mugilogobius chulae]|uniref:Uncharacterized protein n=1 Tax=Mugilogobius chulae TaxID=88201 RepID=A0AAW0N5D7_9GOBI
MEGCCRSCMPCCRRLWDWIWPEFRYPNVPNNKNGTAATVFENPAAEIRTVSGTSARQTAGAVVPGVVRLRSAEQRRAVRARRDKLSVIEKRGDYVLAKKLTGSLESGLIPANYVALLQDEFAKHK